MRLLFLAPLCLMLCGCGDLLSLHPLQLPQEKLFDPSIEGRWENDDNVITVKREGDAYDVTLESKLHKEESSKYEVHLTDIGGVRFADLIWSEALGHMFLKITMKDSEMHLAFMDSKWLRERVAHEESETDGGRTQAVLVHKTPQLREIVRKYAREAKAYDEHDVVYRRMK